MVPTMVFDGHEGPHITSSHNNLLVEEIKVASTLIRRILIDTGSSVDIITWDCLKKLRHLGRKIILLMHPILGFGGQQVNPMGMIWLPLQFGDKIKALNLEVDFLIVDVPTTYNIILVRQTLHKVKAIIASYLLHLQFEADDGSIGKLQGDQRMVRECYLVSILPLVARSAGRGPSEPLPLDKKPRTRFLLPSKP